MNAQLLKRLVRAIASESTGDLSLLAHKMVKAERKIGHNKLADELENLLLHRTKKSEHKNEVFKNVDRSLRELPVSRRNKDVLTTLLPKELLDHHMILPPDTEARFGRIEREYAARDRLSVHGLEHRKTVLLYGPPGCGKSLGAKRLAWNLGLPLMKVRFDAMLSSFFGESLSNLRSIFEAAEATPCVLLLDECDFIARSRGQSKDTGESSRIVNMLLQLMEEFDSPSLLVATTNIESSLDEALFRRFDEVLHIPFPRHEESEKLLKMTLSGVATAKNINWVSIVDTLCDRSAAQIVKIAQDAAKAVVLNGEKIVKEKHLRDSCDDLYFHIPDTLH